MSAVERRAVVVGAAVSRVASVADLDTATTRDGAEASSVCCSRRNRRKWPTWLTPICRSRP